MTQAAAALHLEPTPAHSLSLRVSSSGPGGRRFKSSLPDQSCSIPFCLCASYFCGIPRFEQRETWAPGNTAVISCSERVNEVSYGSAVHIGERFCHDLVFILVHNVTHALHL
jgi:hypothetical protein